MLAVIGTVPQTDFPLTVGEAALDGDRIVIDGRSVDVNRGTPALIAAAAKTAEYLGAPPPVGYLAGDIGRGDGSRLVYEYLCSNLKRSDIDTIVFHYIQPEVDWHNRVLFAVEDMASRPMLIADAGFMYAAKMSGQAPVYDLFTPDAGELAFLADEEAPHPFYTRGFILHEENRAPELIRRAYEHDNAARFLLVKGREDVAADRTGILATVSTHGEEAMEAIGGTGDTLTGIVSALADSGLAVKESMVAAAKANRLAGYLAKPTPATRVTEIIEEIPQALVEVLGKAYTENTQPMYADENPIPFRKPKLACCNFIRNVDVLRAFALKYGFNGVEWSFDEYNLAGTPSSESALAERIERLRPLEVRYHFAFHRIDLGHESSEEARKAADVLRRACALTARLGGRYLTIHVGLGRDSTMDMSWERTIEGLRDLVRFGKDLSVKICLENLAYGWSSRPELYEKLIRKSGSLAVLDIGHARVSPSIENRLYDIEDFVTPHPEKFMGAHVYHKEEGDDHLPPSGLEEMQDRLSLLTALPSCRWWTLELREENALVRTLGVVREFLDAREKREDAFDRAAS